MKSIKFVLAATVAMAALPAIAHGDHQHTAAAEVKMEQKPWGIAGDPKSAARTVEFTMSDAMRFDPDKLEVKRGDTVKFIIRNNGKLMHEMVIGTKKELAEHAALMMKFPNMEHDEPYMAHVAPGTMSELVWNFNRPGTFDFACLIAGHYQAGMVGKIIVKP